jgi:hypothetical protein
MLTWMYNYPLSKHSKTSSLNILDFGTLSINIIYENLVKKKNHQLFFQSWFLTF